MKANKSDSVERGNGSATNRGHRLGEHYTSGRAAIGSAAVIAGVAAAADRRARERIAVGQQGQLKRDGDPTPIDDLELFRTVPR